MTLREYLQINDGWFPDIMEHLQYRYFLDGYMWKIEPIEKQTVQRVPFDMFVCEILKIVVDDDSLGEPYLPFNKTIGKIDKYLAHNYHKEEK